MAPSTPPRRQVKTDFQQKWAVAGPFFHQSGRFQGVRQPKFRCGRSRQFDFSRCMPETGRFGRFLGPRGPKWRIHFLHATQKKRCTGQSECTQVTLFPYKYWVFEEKMQFGPVSGHPGPKRVSGNCRKYPKATGRNCVARSSEGPNGPDLVPTAPEGPAEVKHRVTTLFGLISSP